MNMKLLLIPFIALLLVAVSGCTDPAEPTGPTVETPDLSVDGVVLETGPEGFEYLGVHAVEIDTVKTSYADVEGIVNASEGIYNLDSVDYFIIAIEMTTFQLVNIMNESEVEAEVVQQVEYFLTWCDLVKFAKYSRKIDLKPAGSGYKRPQRRWTYLLVI